MIVGRNEFFEPREEATTHEQDNRKNLTYFIYIFLAAFPLFVHTCSRPSKRTGGDVIAHIGTISHIGA